MSKFYITTAIPYVNAAPHIGHALEFVQADVIARFHKLIGDETLLLSGGDENALKNVQAAEKAGMEVQTFIDTNSVLFENLAKDLHIQFDVFQKGSNEAHHKASQALWNRCFDNGDIYKKTYTGLYCVGCEMFYEKDELNENGECFEHPGKRLDSVSEDNYFFKLSKYQAQLEELIVSGQLAIVPDNRINEMLSFIRSGLKDISISRSNERAKNWGVTVPNDATQKMYVWFDALNIYQSGVGFPSDEATYQKWWPADIHIIGKGILRFHAVYWPAFLLSAKLPLPKSIFVHGYFTVNGQKMSKTLGNVVNPHDMIKKIGADALRYYLLKDISSTGDGDFSEEKLTQVYNADLANGLGNLIARTAKLCENAQFTQMTPSVRISPDLASHPEYLKALEHYRFNDALFYVWQQISAVDAYISQEKPWELLKQINPRVKEVLAHAVGEIQEIAYLLMPFMPETAQTILEQFNAPEVKAQESLFPRIK